MNNELTTKPLLSVPYQRSLFFQVLWLVWGVFGFVFLYNDLGNTSLEILILFFYTLIIITAVMAGFNRQNGMNHRIQFYDDYMLVPFPMMLWFWQERIIKYADIKKISFVNSLAPGNHTIPFDMHLHLKYERYRILCSKLNEETYSKVFNQLKSKVGFEFQEFMDKAAPENSFPPEQGAKHWNWRLKGMKFIALLWCIGAFAFSAPYLWLFEGTYFIVYTFIFVIWANLLLHWLIPNQVAFANVWQKSLFHVLMGLYLGLGFLQSLMAINGYFDQSAPQVVTGKILEKTQVRSGGLICYQVQIPQQISGRTIASEANPKGITRQLEVCNPEGDTWQIGGALKLNVKKGALGERWLSQIHPSP